MKKLLLSIAVLVTLAGCSSAASNDPHGNHGNMDESKGDVQIKTGSADELPFFVKNKPERTQMIYTVAAKNTNLLQSIPCYCGCGSAGHKNNADCFIKEKQTDGIVWDSHATKCGVCMEIAYESVQLQGQGKTVKEIRTYIDDKYTKAGAKPTPTPMPN